MGDLRVTSSRQLVLEELLHPLRRAGLHRQPKMNSTNQENREAKIMKLRSGNHKENRMGLELLVPLLDKAIGLDDNAAVLADQPLDVRLRDGRAIGAREEHNEAALIVSASHLELDRVISVVEGVPAALEASLDAGQVDITWHPKTKTSVLI